jgi:hypothetical protein
MCAPNTLGFTDVADMLLSSVLVPAELGSRVLLAIVVQVAKALAIVALCSRCCLIDPFHSDTHSSNIKPMANGSACFFWSRES